MAENHLYKEMIKNNIPQYHLVVFLKKKIPIKECSNVFVFYAGNFAFLTVSRNGWQS